MICCNIRHMKALLRQKWSYTAYLTLQNPSFCICLSFFQCLFCTGTQRGDQAQNKHGSKLWWALSKTKYHSHVFAIAFRTSMPANIFQSIITMFHFIFNHTRKSMQWCGWTLVLNLQFSTSLCVQQCPWKHTIQRLSCAHGAIISNTSKNWLQEQHLIKCLLYHWRHVANEWQYDVVQSLTWKSFNSYLLPNALTSNGLAQKTKSWMTTCLTFEFAKFIGIIVIDQFTACNNTNPWIIFFQHGHYHNSLSPRVIKSSLYYPSNVVSPKWSNSWNALWLIHALCNHCWLYNLSMPLSTK